jgi:ferredoxin
VTVRSEGVVQIWRIEVDRDRCMGTGACVFTAPEVFDLDGDGVARVIGEVDGDDELVVNAVDECPMAALTLRKAD